MPNYPMAEVSLYIYQKQPRNIIIVEFAIFEQKAF